MAFDQSDVDRLLAETGRMCAVCGTLHHVQVHHIQPSHQGGPDTYDNAIPLCPNCHNEVHSEYGKGRVSRMYTETELRQHLARTKGVASKRVAQRPGGKTWKEDVELLRFFGLCLDRPAFRTYFHQELSFTDFDQAMEDTILALNTGHWRTRDGDVIERGKGKSHLVNPHWRSVTDEVVKLITEARTELRQALALNQMILTSSRFDRSRYDENADAFRSDGLLVQRIDELRQRALDEFNIALAEAGLNHLANVGY